MAARTQTRSLSGLDREALLRLYRNMLLSRRVDEKEIQLKRQNRIYFQINGVGHEAIGAAVGETFRPGHDWFFFYYRDRAAALSLGLTAKEMFLQAVGDAEDPQGGGRQMPSHFSSPPLHIANTSSPTGTQFLQAVGCAEAGLYAAKRGGDLTRVSFEKDEVVLVTAGDGTTSEGEFWEAMNTASNRKLPVVFLIEDNGYAISVPVEVNTAGGSISKLVASFPDLLLREVDGCDPLASVEALRAAVAHCRARRGPAMVHAHVIRPFSHSLSDDETQYRTPEEREQEAKRDPLLTFPHRLLLEGIADEAELKHIEAEVDAEVQRSPPTTRWRSAARRSPSHRSSTSTRPTTTPPPASWRPPRAWKDNPARWWTCSIAACATRWRAIPRIVLFGQDVADASREG